MPVESLSVWSQSLTFEIFQKYFPGGHSTLAPNPLMRPDAGRSHAGPLSCGGFIAFLDRDLMRHILFKPTIKQVSGDGLGRYGAPFIRLSTVASMSANCALTSSRFILCCQRCSICARMSARTRSIFSTVIVSPTGLRELSAGLPHCSSSLPMSGIHWTGRVALVPSLISPQLLIVFRLTGGLRKRCSSVCPFGNLAYRDASSNRQKKCPLQHLPLIGSHSVQNDVLEARLLPSRPSHEAPIVLPQEGGGDWHAPRSPR